MAIIAFEGIGRILGFSLVFHAIIAFEGIGGGYWFSSVFRAIIAFYGIGWILDLFKLLLRNLELVGFSSDKELKANIGF